ncbi:unnamed protein product [Mytilus edulis]|uniref:Uncharacterized protein n=1 Tax=Mytilus edulis TaxID=6550 RepID=A0A8S3TP40_MYTED|nr:unnamed protein product [Mytilus edulis]
MQYAKKGAIDEKKVELGIQLNYPSFHLWLSINPTEEERKKADLCWEACRYITSTLCKHVNKESKMGKYASPPDWSAEYETFQNPYNEKSGHDIKIFFKDLLDYCSKRDQGNWIPQEIKSYITACEAWIKDPKQQKDLLQEYVLHHDVTVIKENLRLLQSECSLCNVTSILEERGITLLGDIDRTVSLQSDPIPTSRKRKLKDSETTEKKYEKMQRNNVEISELETAQKNMAILKATDAKVSPKERKLRTKMEIWIKMTLNGEPIKVITHGYNPDFSKFKEVQQQDALQKQENASLEITDEYLNESKILVSEIPELEDYTEISTIKPVNATDDKSIHNPLPSLYKNDCVQKSRHSIKCPVESEFCTDIKISGTYQSSEINQLYNCSSPEMSIGTLSPDAHIHRAFTEENSSNTASNDNNLNNEYHDDNLFDDILLNNDDFQFLLSIIDNGNIMNRDSTIDLIDSFLADTNIMTRGSSSSINGQSYNDDNHLISDQSINFPDIDFLYVENTN